MARQSVFLFLVTGRLPNTGETPLKELAALNSPRLCVLDTIAMAKYGISAQLTLDFDEKLAFCMQEMAFINPTAGTTCGGIYL